MGAGTGDVTMERRNYRHIEVRRVAGALGAELHGVDLARDLADDVVGEIRQAWLDHLVVFFRDQKITPAQQLAFARRLGEPMAYPQLKGLDDYPMITPVMKDASSEARKATTFAISSGSAKRPSGTPDR